MQRVLLMLLLLSTASLAGCFDGFRNIVTGQVGPEDYISGDYDRWHIEVDYVTGHRPSQSALTLLERRLGELVDKPVDITVTELPGAGRSSWTDGALTELRERNQNVVTGASNVVTYVNYVDGSYAGGDAVGLAIGHDHVIIFDELIEDGANPIPLLRTADVEGAVLVHEFGHVLGLVNRGTPMQTAREDPNSRHHSTNRESVMYFAVETTDVFNFFTGGPPDTFDRNDKADVCAAGGRC